MPSGSIGKTLMKSFVPSEAQPTAAIFVMASDQSSLEGTRIFDKSGQLLGSGKSINEACSLVLKDPLKLFTGGRTNMFKMVQSLQLSGSSYSLAVLKISGGGVNAQSAASDQDSRYIVYAGYTKVCLYDVELLSTSLSVDLADATVEVSPGLAYLPQLDAYAIAKLSTSIPIVRRSDLTAISNPSYRVGFEVHGITLDNLQTDRLFLSGLLSGNPCVDRYSAAQLLAGPTMQLAATVDVSQYGSYNNILNFGPYQYVVTIPSSGSQFSKVVFMEKDSLFVAGVRSLASPSSPEVLSPSFSNHIIFWSTTVLRE